MFFKVTENFSGFEQGQIVEIHPNYTLYNIYEAVYIKDEDGNLELYRSEDRYLVDSVGDILNFDVFSHGANNVWIVETFYDENGDKITDFTQFTHDGDVYVYWNGHNWIGIQPQSESNPHTFLEPYEWDGVYKVVEDGEWSRGVKESIVDASNGQTLKMTESQYQGSFTIFEEIY